MISRKIRHILRLIGKIDESKMFVSLINCINAGNIKGNS